MWLARLFSVRASATILAVASALARPGNLGRLAAGLLGLAAAVGTFVIAEGPGAFTTYAGVSGSTAVLSALTGMSLIVAGLVTSFQRPAGLTGDLALLAGLTWVAPILVGWEGGPPLIRSIGMVLLGFTFPLVFHLAMAWPRGQLRSPVDRGMVWVVYLESALAAVALALFRDPFFDPDCWANCTVNTFLVRSLPPTARTIEVADRWFTVAAASALIVVCLWRMSTNSPPARRALIPVALPAIAFAVASAAHAIALEVRPIEDPLDRVFLSIFAFGSTALILLAAGMLWAVFSVRIDKKAVARIVTSLDEAPPPGSLEWALARALGDPDLSIAYWLPQSQNYVDATGHFVSEPAATPGRTITTLVRGDQRIAVVSHSATFSELTGEIGAGVRLALENERLQAELLAQVEELRLSRARVVETGDAERRRLERDLHDGTQQLLLSLSYEIRGARASAEADTDEDTMVLLDEAIDEAQAALVELRDLAHGIYPAILSEAGLASALASYVDDAPLPVGILGVANGRFPPAVEMAAYLLVIGAVELAVSRGATHAVVNAVQEDTRLVLTVEDDGDPRPITPPIALADRVGALGGSLEVGPMKLRAEIMCE